MAKKVIICEYCKKVIKRPKINQKYHKPCHKEYRKEYKRKKEKEYYKSKTSENRDKICVFCKARFIAEHGNDKYCLDCKINYKSIVKGFKSLEEERSFKKKICVECFAPLIYDYELDTFKCLNCGYSRRPPTPVKKNSYPRINLFKYYTDSPYDLEFQDIRGKNQNQYSSNISENNNKLYYNTYSIDEAFCEGCGMLKPRCTCESTVQKIE